MFALVGAGIYNRRYYLEVFNTYTSRSWVILIKMLRIIWAIFETARSVWRGLESLSSSKIIFDLDHQRTTTHCVNLDGVTPAGSLTVIMNNGHWFSLVFCKVTKAIENPLLAGGRQNIRWLSWVAQRSSGGVSHCPLTLILVVEWLWRFFDFVTQVMLHEPCRTPVTRPTFLFLCYYSEEMWHIVHWVTYLYYLIECYIYSLRWDLPHRLNPCGSLLKLQYSSITHTFQFYKSKPQLLIY